MGENIANQRRRILDVIGPSGRVTNLANVQYNTDIANIYATNFIGNFDGLIAVSGNNRGVVFNDDGFINSAPNFFYTSAGDVRIDSNLTVLGNFTVIGSNNTVLSDPIFEIASNVEYGYDTGYMIQRPAGNVVIGHLASGVYENVLVISYTDSSAYNTSITPDTSKHLEVEVIGNVTANYYSGNAAQLISLTAAGAGTYGQKTNDFTFDIPEIVVNSDGRITEIRSNVISIGDSSNLDNVVKRGNATSNTILFQNAYVAFITSANVGIANSAPEHTLSIGSNIYFDDTGSNTLVTTGNLSAPYITSNGKYLTDTTDAAEGVYGGVIDDHSANIAVVTIGSDGRLESVSNTTFTLTETSNLDEVVNRGNATANTVLFQNASTAFTTISNVGIANSAPGHLLSVGANLYVENSGNLVTTNNVNANYYFGNASKLISLTSAAEGTYGGNSNATHMNVATITVDSDGYITSISNTSVLTETSNLDQVVNRGNTTANVVVFEAGLLSEGNLVVSSNLSVGSNLTVIDSGSNILTVVGNVHADRYSGNAAQMVSLTGASEGTYGGNSNATHMNVATITVDSTGYITSISNTTVLTETSNLAQVVNRGNVTANTVQFTNPKTAFTTDLTSNVEMNLGQLANVAITNPADFQVLQYNDDGWINDFVNFSAIKVKAGEALSKGEAVYVSDGQGVKPVVMKADASVPAKMPSIGVMYENLNLNAEGSVVTFGIFTMQIDSDFNPHELLYVSNTTPGGLSNVIPDNHISPDLIQNIGICIKSGSGGKLLVSGIGRANDIPNANIVTDTSLVDYVYFNNSGNNFLKIDPNLLETKTPNLEQVVNVDNVTTNVVQFNSGLVTSANVGIGNINPQHLLSLGEGEIFFNGNVVVLGTESAISIGKVQAAQETGAIAIGDEAGETLQESNTVAIGVRAGRNNQGTKGVAIGDRAGESNQAEAGVAIGEGAARNGQAKYAISIGQSAGTTDQGLSAIAIGINAASDTQGSYAIAIGVSAGVTSQGENAIAIGRNASENATQGQNAIAIGKGAARGGLGQGDNAIAIGSLAGKTAAQANTIILNASGQELNSIATDSVYIKNFRNSTSQYTNVLSSNLTSGEVITSVIVVSGSNVGLGGNTVPQHELSVEGNTYSNLITQIIRFNNGDSADVVEGLTLLDVTQNGNNTTEILQFNNSTTSFVTSSNVGIANSSPVHALSVDGNVYISNTLFVNSITADLSKTSNVITYDPATGELFDSGGSGSGGGGGGGGGGGSNVVAGTAGQVAYYSDSVTVKGNDVFTFDETTSNIDLTGNLIATGQITTGSVANVESNILSLETSNGLAWSNITALKTDLGLYESNIHLGGFNVGINPKNSFTPSANLHVVGNIFSSSNIDTSGPIGINSNHYIRELVSNATDRSLLIGFDGNTDRVRIGQGTGGKPIVNMYGGTSGSNKIETTFPIHLNNGVFSIIRDHPTTPTLATGLSLSFGSILPASNYLLNTGDVNFGASAYKWKDMYANAYFNFTGTHIAGNYLDIPDGSIVISTGNVESLSITETKAEIALCNVSKDKRVIGVTIKTVEIIENQDDIVSSGVIALGEGRMWVCNENGNIENGDYIYSSNVAGHGMKQDDDLLHNYTVAKATEDCSFTGPDDKKLISVTFHCG